MPAVAAAAFPTSALLDRSRALNQARFTLS